MYGNRCESDTWNYAHSIFEYILDDDEDDDNNDDEDEESHVDLNHQLPHGAHILTLKATLMSIYLREISKIEIDIE